MCPRGTSTVRTAGLDEAMTPAEKINSVKSARRSRHARGQRQPLGLATTKAADSMKR